MKPQVSVIIPIYNGQRTIMKALNSLKNQTFKNFEVITIDDGSIDRTKEIINKYQNEDSRIKYYYQQNSGVSIARNKGFEISNGNFICFLDSDDYFENTYLEKMYERIIKTDSNVCYCGYNIVTPNYKTIKKTCFRKGDILAEYILGKISIPTTGWMIKKDFLLKNNIKFTEGVSWGEDFEFFCEVLARTNKVCYVDEYLTNYVVGFYKDRLSSFSIDKIDKDFESIMRLVKNPIVNKNKKINNALIEYRLQALIIYRIVKGYNLKVDVNILLKYWDKYKKNIMKPTFNNGLRSIKLNLNKIKLLYVFNKLI
ncbi:glycosyltransferase [Anaerosalibacter bizertensis]|uniref:glycosyltransferase family 2 protein n=1 Tax=Anaerosalibacter bizertensis TaxID=932217 RepID=UPI001C0EAFAD|nr:glycosyltransferase family 2 protein [Anaerosalibacter bizertensis]MBU5294094.1 glycosyltransferase [Anaerosalibacter bizertensis]